VIVLDTHVLLWARSDPGKLSRAAARALQADPDQVISAISCWEVTMLAARGRISINRPVATWLRQALAATTVVDLSCNIAVRAGELDVTDFPGDPADRIIWATAWSLGAPLLTADRALRAFDPKATIW
jgi:PIN domain nuclease of toxin-antitoxin system